MNRKPYPAYKDSNIEWLGNIPAHWRTLPLKYLFQIVGGSTPQSENDQFWNGNIVWITPSDLSGVSTLHIKDSERKITLEGLASCSATLVPSESIILSTRAPIGLLAIAGTDLCTNQGCKALVSKKNVQSIFFAYLLSVSAKELNLRGRGTTFLELSGSELGAFKVPVPSLEEQLKITQFLNFETRKIDALIDKQKSLIQLLKEQRQAIISHAVRNGLLNDVNMRDDDVEWLGRTPLHWEIVRHKAIFQEVDERSKEDEGELLTVSHITGVTPRSEKNVNMFLAETLEGYKKCRAGDLVINTMWAWMGALGISPCDGLVSPSYNVYRLRTSHRVYQRYYEYYSRTEQHISVIKACSTGVWDSRLRLYPDVFLNLRIAVPPYHEQKAIVDYLDKKIPFIDVIIAKAMQSIELMSEHRTTLIIAAVTGKINVCGQLNNNLIDETASSEAANDNSAENILFAIVASSFGNGRNFNKIALAKAYFLVGVHSGFVNAKTGIQKHAAGPHNAERFEENEAIALSKGWINKVSGKSQLYSAGKNLSQLSIEFRNTYGHRAEKIYSFIADIKALNNDELEICATLYDCWLDRYSKNLTYTDNDLIVAFKSYSPRKQKFTSSQIQRVLLWMKKKKVSPVYKESFLGYPDQQADPNQIIMAL